MSDLFPPDALNALGLFGLFLAIVLATFVSEDLTCLGVGLLIGAGRIDPVVGLFGCFVGIVLGDLGMWLVGRGFGSRALRWRWVRRILSERRLAEMSGMLCRHGGRAAFVSRFLPGTRVPLFLAAGVLGTCPYKFLSWSVIAAILWTPLIVGAAAILGDVLVEPFLESPTLALILPVVALSGFFALRLVTALRTPVGRGKVLATVSRLWRWEFWPAWVFYLPLVPWYAWLAIRYRGVTVWTSANPGIPAGGVVGESKADILARLPAKWTVPTQLVTSGELSDRLRLALDVVARDGWEYPLILKPDAGLRGAGVKKCRDADEVEAYLRDNPAPVIVQPYHPGPFEAGIFYYRIPGEPSGRILSITDKVFPVLTGDGQATLKELIWKHPRFRMQAKTFLARHAADANRVLLDGEAFPLALAGNHCQGTMFRDGAHLLTPELERAIDGIARSFDGFFIGRFDVRYASAEELRAGRGFAVLELNGATSESTNLYDPSWPLWRAYRTLFRQWRLLFRIGRENRRRGRKPSSPQELFSLLRTYYRTRTVSLLSD